MRSAMSFSAVCVWLFLAAISAPATVCGTFIFDTNGRPVLQGVPYYIVPAKSPFDIVPPKAESLGGGVIPVSRSNNVSELLCPLDVAQSASSSNRGSPVYFFSYSKVYGLQTSDVIRIEFGPGEWPCTLSKMWRIRYSPQSNQTFISTGGATNQPNSQFAIRWDSYAYKFVHVSEDSPKKGTNVGVFTDNADVRRLILTAEPLRFKFQPLQSKTDRSEKTMLKTLPFFY